MDTRKEQQRTELHNTKNVIKQKIRATSCKRI